MITRRWKPSFAALALFFLCRQAHGAHPLLTDDTETIGKGRWQLEVNGERQRDPQSNAPPLRAIQSGTTLSYGLSDSLDLEADLPYLRHQGVFDLAVGAKWRFHEAGRLSFGLQGAVFLPTGDEEKGLGAGRVNAGLSGIAYWAGTSWELQSQAGWRSNSNTISQRDWLGHFSAAVAYRPVPNWWLIADVAWDSNPSSAEGSLRNVVYGVIWGVTRDIELDAGIRRGNDPAIDTAVLFGITLRW